ncbi:hypothetical protein CEN44_10365 [Fischerella muscicola CCMEE 5323]|uniref:Uncharacterized protein n=1 Tax=Fischerella muscicola CCMEE 5323 TaxID=2019572 RepID=A0A2N6K431_FISMU|nr:hypothetical protein [Fischerella muscicola]PLZ90636.1 hypothetical protein CEN44_10365 [Fischerella muscicola CCMEE 5323]
MQLKVWKNFLVKFLLTSSGINWYFFSVDAVGATNLDFSNFGDQLGEKTPSLLVDQINNQPYQQPQSERINSKSPFVWSLNWMDGVDVTFNDVVPEKEENVPVFSTYTIFSTGDSTKLYSQATQKLPSVQPESTLKYVPEQIEQPNELLQLETQPTYNSTPLSTQANQSLEAPEIQREKRLQRLIQRLQRNSLPSLESNVDDIDEELGKLRLREVTPTPEEPQLPPIEQPANQFKPVGYLLARVGYFYSSNIFSSGIVPIEDSLIYSGLTLGSVSFPVGEKTFINGSVDGYLIRYLDQSEYNYNQVRFNLNLQQRFTPRMYGEIGWSNQQLFYARDSNTFDAGDRFLGENVLRLAVGRRDIFSQKLTLDSFYEFRLSLTDPPEDRNRIINFFWLSLSYYLQRSLQAGVDYQFSLSNFTERDREDLYNRFFGHLNYGISKNSNISVQAGVTLGDPTENNINFDGWFFGINYNLELGRF